MQLIKITIGQCFFVNKIETCMYKNFCKILHKIISQTIVIKLIDFLIILQNWTMIFNLMTGSWICLKFLYCITDYYIVNYKNIFIFLNLKKKLFYINFENWLNNIIVRIIVRLKSLIQKFERNSTNRSINRRSIDRKKYTRIQKCCD